MRKVVIVVPLYKIELSKLENISLMQLYRVLGKYPIVYACPEKMRTTLSGSALTVEFFPDGYFQNVQSYSRLCLEKMFYERFQMFEFMLIYQTDAFVFKDDLSYWCNQGYDYIGAPWPWILHRTEPFRLKKRVGNGGLSLRRITSILRVLQMKEKILDTFGNPDELLDAEDLFFSYAYTLDLVDFRLPRPAIATQFSLERHNERKVQNILKGGAVPFGCHGWSNAWDYSLWYPIISRIGYDLPRPSARQYRVECIRYERLERICQYLRERRGPLTKKNLSLKWLMKFFVIIKFVRLHVVDFQDAMNRFD